MFIACIEPPSPSHTPPDNNNAPQIAETLLAPNGHPSDDNQLSTQPPIFLVLLASKAWISSSMA